MNSYFVKLAASLPEAEMVKLKYLYQGTPDAAVSFIKKLRRNYPEEMKNLPKVIYGLIDNWEKDFTVKRDENYRNLLKALRTLAKDTKAGIPEEEKRKDRLTAVEAIDELRKQTDKIHKILNVDLRKDSLRLRSIFGLGKPSMTDVSDAVKEAVNVLMLNKTLTPEQIENGRRMLMQALSEDSTRKEFSEFKKKPKPESVKIEKEVSLNAIGLSDLPKQLRLMESLGLITKDESVQLDKYYVAKGNFVLVQYPFSVDKQLETLYGSLVKQLEKGPVKKDKSLTDEQISVFSTALKRSIIDMDSYRDALEGKKGKPSRLVVDLVKGLNKGSLNESQVLPVLRLSFSEGGLAVADDLSREELEAIMDAFLDGTLNDEAFGNLLATKNKPYNDYLIYRSKDKEDRGMDVFHMKTSSARHTGNFIRISSDLAKANPGRILKELTDLWKSGAVSDIVRVARFIRADLARQHAAEAVKAVSIFIDTVEGK